MTFLRFALPLLAALATAPAPRAEGIPGADDPALRAAAEAWLADDDPRPALRVIGEMAADGNTAARLLARSLEVWLFLDFPELSRKERRALFPPDRSGPSSGLILYPVAREDAPAAFLAEGMHLSTTPDEWIARATALLDAGLRQAFLQQLRVALSYPHLNIEAARFAEDVVTDADPEQARLWIFRQEERLRLELLDARAPAEAAALRARWGGPPWSPRQETAFAEALAAGRWSAVRADGYRVLSGIGAPVDAPTAAQSGRWARLESAARAGGLRDHPPPTAAELDRLGVLLLADAPHSPHLWPARTACEAACPADTRRCMATAALRHGPTFAEVPIHLEPVLSAEAYLSSDHAARQFLVWAGAVARTHGFGPEWLPVPRCFRDAAEREADRVHPAGRPRTPPG